MRNYDEATVVRELNKKAGCNVDGVRKVITIVRDTDSLGNKSWGKIDYLIKVHKYIYVFTTSNIKTPVYSTDEKPTKAVKKESKLNMAAMTKNAMKKAKK